MGFSCPVCETPQHDSEHLANHLAMTAMLHEDDHEAWLDEHVDGWGELTPPELGQRVVDAAEQVDYDEAAVEAADIPEEFRDGDEQGTGDATDAADAAPRTDRGSPARGSDELDEETKEVLAEARELTEKRRENAAEGPDDEADEARGDEREE
ncbi:MAG: DUF5810 domain-containing protein [Halolamina sp.]